jgi:hypothetical protein
MENETQVQLYVCQLMDKWPEEQLSENNFRQWLSNEINYLIVNDFDALLLLLYRIDVHEEKVRKMLSEHSNEKASDIIADLIIERQQQKMATRKLFASQQQRPTDVDESELW